MRALPPLKPVCSSAARLPLPQAPTAQSAPPTDCLPVCSCCPFQPECLCCLHHCTHSLLIPQHPTRVAPGPCGSASLPAWSILPFGFPAPAVRASVLAPVTWCGRHRVTCRILHSLGTTMVSSSSSDPKSLASVWPP